MKLTTLALVSLAALATAANGASLQVDNITSGFDGNDLALLDNAGNGLAAGGGFVAVYDFGAGAGSPPSNVVALVANGANGLLASIDLQPGNAPVSGALFTLLDFANPGPPNGAGALDGTDLYLMIGNGSNAGDSTELALINTGLRTGNSDAPIPSSLAFSLRSGADVIVGSIVATTVDWAGVGGSNGHSTAGLRLDAVPEPTSSMLLGLAGLAFFIRRKR
jgi:hypothetical protein